jgi:hypothetical protein
MKRRVVRDVLSKSSPKLHRCITLHSSRRWLIRTTNVILRLLVISGFINSNPKRNMWSCKTISTSANHTQL